MKWTFWKFLAAGVFITAMGSGLAMFFGAKASPNPNYPLSDSATGVVIAVLPVPDVDNPRSVVIVVESAGFDLGACQNLFFIGLPATDTLVKQVRTNTVVKIEFANKFDCSSVRAIRPLHSLDAAAIDSLVAHNGYVVRVALLRSSL